MAGDYQGTGGRGHIEVDVGIGFGVDIGLRSRRRTVTASRPRYKRFGLLIRTALRRRGRGGTVVLAAARLLRAQPVLVQIAPYAFQVEFAQRPLSIAAPASIATFLPSSPAPHRDDEWQGREVWGLRCSICPSAPLPQEARKYICFAKGKGFVGPAGSARKTYFIFFKKIACGIGGKTITYILRVWQLTSCTNRSSRLAYFVIFSISLRRTSISFLKFKSFPGRIGTRNGRRREHCRKRSQKALLLRGITVLQFQKHSKKQNQHRT